VRQLRPMCTETYGTAGSLPTVVIVLHAVENIRKTVFRLVVSTLLAMAPFLAYALLGGSSNADTPGTSVAGLLIHVSWVFLSLSSLFLTLYLDDVARSKLAGQSLAAPTSSAAEQNVLVVAENSKGG